jgi:hypothetical protein
VKKLSPLTPKQRARQEQSRAIWKHNSFLGHAALARKNMLTIIDSETAIDSSRDMAKHIYRMLGDLEISLKTRKDQIK